MKLQLFVRLCSLSLYILLCQANLSRIYKVLYNGGQKVIGSYTLHKTVSNVRCANICYNTPGCWLYTWDTVNKECQVLDFLDDLITTGPAPSTLRTYYVDSINDKKIIETPSTSTWTQSNDSCSSMGGRLFLPEDNTYCYILNHVFGENRLFIGMWRFPSDTTVWYNMDGQTTFPRPAWGPGQPNNYYGKQYYGSCSNGMVDDVSITYINKGICEV
ncbi:hypothetical protein SK128_010898 [Halocaridina rubra]|uniref:PAN-3 domain-containing protein n=1 Tax=Halocaridina rubra TaxID=373956 RepID=A0AAN9A161_HALRR